MRIGLIDVDGKRFPNYALMKIAAYHKMVGDSVEWANNLERYDRIYKSKIFRFSQEDITCYNCDDIVTGGTGYSLTEELPEEIEVMSSDYSIYPYIDRRTAYGFLTRGCPNKCSWCVVPIKEGKVRPYRDVDEIAVDGRKNLILMDNNILACDYGLEQIQKIIDRRYRVDFNQALDARLVTDNVAKLLAKVRWLNNIRIGCDTQKQVVECERAMSMIDGYRGKLARYLLYAMIIGDIDECYERLSHFRDNNRVRMVTQPYRDFDNPKQVIPQWQRDMARWGMRRELYAVCDFKDFEPRKNFRCDNYFK